MRLKTGVTPDPITAAAGTSSMAADAEIVGTRASGATDASR